MIFLAEKTAQKKKSGIIPETTAPYQRLDFCFAPITDTLARRMDFLTIGFATGPDSPLPRPPRAPPRPRPRPPLRPPRASPVACSSLRNDAPALNRWFGPGLFVSPSDFGTRRIWPFTPFTCTHWVVPVFPIIKLLTY
jgi:hypothetical protein